MIVTIREATRQTSDLDALAEMAAALQAHVEKSNRDLWQQSPEGRRRLRDALVEAVSEPNAEVLLGLDESGEAVGMAAGRILHHPQYMPALHGQIERVFVREEYRGRGTGRRLVRSLCEFFAQHDVKDVSLRYAVGNVAAEAVWSGLGFRRRIVTCGMDLADLLGQLPD